MGEKETENPFVGARPFERDSKDRALFFGRDQETVEIASLIFGHPAVLIYAQSGAGKTSLLNIKVACALEEQRFEVPPLVRIRSVLLAEGKVKNLYVFNLLSNLQPAANVEELKKKSISTFLNQLPRGTDSRGRAQPRVIICDQFEEFFGLYPEGWRQQREDFFQQVTAALDEDPLLRFVFVLREDYLAQLDPFARFLPEGFRPHFRLERLRQGAALLAVTRPLHKGHIFFSKGVAEFLVDNLMKIRIERPKTDSVETIEVTGEFVDPMQLQVVCHSMWDRVRQDGAHEITRKYVVDVDQALADFYENAIEAAASTGPHRHVLRQWCQSYLITSTGTRSLIHREPEMTAGIPNEALDILQEKHLINREWRSGAEWYELTHDRLIEPIRKSNEKWSAFRVKQGEGAATQFQQAGLALARQEYDVALEGYKKALRIYEEIAHPPGALWSLLNLGHIQQQQGQTDDALRAYLRALEIAWQTRDKANIIPALTLLGNLEHERENFDHAAAYFTNVLALEPENHTALRARAAAYWYAGHFNEALSDFGEELNHDPQSIHALNGRGQLLAELGSYEAALADLDQALKARSDDPIYTAYVRNGRGLALGGLRRYEEALKEFDASIQACPENGWVYFNRALTYERMGNTDRAKDDYRSSLEKKSPVLVRRKRAVANQRLEDLERLPA